MNTSGSITLLRFWVRRASGIGLRGNDPPCNNAYLEIGKYFINIHNLDELMALIEEVGSIVIDDEEIIIYDSYLE